MNRTVNEIAGRTVKAVNVRGLDQIMARLWVDGLRC